MQFPKAIRDPNQRLVETSHLGEEQQQLLLHQGSVVQFPQKLVKTGSDRRDLEIPEEAVKEQLPPAQVEHPDHLLPSQARKQQAYNTHPHHLMRMNPAFSSNPNHKKQLIWPPTKSSVRNLPRVGFNSGNVNPESEFYSNY